MVEDPVLSGWRCSLSCPNPCQASSAATFRAAAWVPGMLLSGGVLAWPVCKALGSIPSSVQTNQQCPGRGGQDDLILRDPGQHNSPEKESKVGNVRQSTLDGAALTEE